MLRFRCIVALFVLYLIAGFVLEETEESQSRAFFGRYTCLFVYQSDWYILRLLQNTQRFIFYLLVAPIPYLLGFLVLWALVHFSLLTLYGIHKQVKEKKIYIKEVNIPIMESTRQSVI